MARKRKPDIVDIVAERKATNLNQSEYWTRFGVTQSGGSRYESGRAGPCPSR
jgi:DNA-binding transcriptional regulator YiaG